MEDTTVAAALRAYVSDEPPSRLDSAAVLTAGRRSRRWHRLGRIGGSITTLAALGLVVLLLVPGLVRGPAPGAAPRPAAGPQWTVLDPAPFCAAASAPAPNATPGDSSVNQKNGFTIKVPSEPAAHASARLSCYLLRTVPRYLPGTVYTRSPNAAAGSIPLQVGLYPPPESFLSAAAIVTNAGGTGEIGFGVRPADESTSDAVVGCTGPCSIRTGPHGEVVAVVTGNLDGVLLVRVQVFQGDTIVYGTASNGDFRNAPPSTGVERSGSPTIGRSDPPLTAEQLIEIIATPALTLFP